MSKANSAPKEGNLQTVSQLLEISKIDTLYRDFYYQRGRELMEPLLSYPSYARIKEGLASLGWVEKQLRAAIERSDWAKSRELTERIRGLQGAAAASGERLKIGEDLYDGAAGIMVVLDDCMVTPFTARPRRAGASRPSERV